MAYFVGARSGRRLFSSNSRRAVNWRRRQKVVAITVHSDELGERPSTPKLQRLRELARIATEDGVVVGVLTQEGRISQDPDTAVVLCQQVKGLG